MKQQLNKGWIYQNQISEKDSGKSILRFYSERYSHSSLAEWREKFFSRQIYLNSKLAAPENILKKGDLLAYHRAPWMEPAVPDNFNILIHDDNIVAVNKPAGLPVMPAGNFLEHTLQSLLQKKIGQAVTPVHRLGRGTSGIVLFALNKRTEKQLFRDMRERKIVKIYRALVTGVPVKTEFTATQKIGKLNYPVIGSLFAASADGKDAESRCKILQENQSEQTAIIEIRLITGRPHQIRIHLAAEGFPLVGDPLYGVGGKPKINQANPILPGECGYHLHAGELRFYHPQKQVQMIIKSEYPSVLKLKSF